MSLLPEMNNTSMDEILPLWWFNIRKNGGMRLTTDGYNAFVKDLDIDHWSYLIDDPFLFTQQTLLKLDRKMQMPYYIETKKRIPKRIIFFGSKEAVMINLYGDLQQFLNNYSP